MGKQSLVQDWVVCLIVERNAFVGKHWTELQLPPKVGLSILPKCSEFNRACIPRWVLTFIPGLCRCIKSLCTTPWTAEDSWLREGSSAGPGWLHERKCHCCIRKGVLEPFKLYCHLVTEWWQLSCRVTHSWGHLLEQSASEAFLTILKGLHR